MPDKTFVFEKGIPGFEQYRTYIRRLEENAPFAHLWAADREEIGFLLVNPFPFCPDYEFDMPEEARREIGIEADSADGMTVWAIVTLQTPVERSTLNLFAPIVMNESSGKGKQIILHESAYSTRHPLVPAGRRAVGGEAL